jgi:hypothetical protein
MSGNTTIHDISFELFKNNDNVHYNTNFSSYYRNGYNADDRAKYLFDNDNKFVYNSILSVINGTLYITVYKYSINEENKFSLIHQSYSIIIKQNYLIRQILDPKRNLSMIKTGDPIGTDSDGHLLIVLVSVDNNNNNDIHFIRMKCLDLTVVSAFSYSQTDTDYDFNGINNFSSTQRTNHNFITLPSNLYNINDIKIFDSPLADGISMTNSRKYFTNIIAFSASTDINNSEQKIYFITAATKYLYNSTNGYEFSFEGLLEIDVTGNLLTDDQRILLQQTIPQYKILKDKEYSRSDTFSIDTSNYAFEYNIVDYIICYSEYDTTSNQFNTNIKKIQVDPNFSNINNNVNFSIDLNVSELQFYESSTKPRVSVYDSTLNTDPSNTYIPYLSDNDLFKGFRQFEKSSYNYYIHFINENNEQRILKLFYVEYYNSYVIEDYLNTNDRYLDFDVKTRFKNFYHEKNSINLSKSNISFKLLNFLIRDQDIIYSLYLIKFKYPDGLVYTDEAVLYIMAYSTNNNYIILEEYTNEVSVDIFLGGTNFYYLLNNNSNGFLDVFNYDNKVKLLYNICVKLENQNYTFSTLRLFDLVDTDGDGDINAEDYDDDNDQVPDNTDAFPLDPTETRDDDGDGIGNNQDTDDDGDGVPDTQDDLPLDSTETLDTDGDWWGNNIDQDDDGDGVPDTQDVFPLDSSETLDTDGDGIGNYADTDDDGDGYPDISDALPLDSTETLDTDLDGIGDNADTFPLDSTETLDTDNDGVGDNADDLPLDSTETLDTDGDGIGNNMATDDDGDGIIDGLDYFPLDSSETLDTDGDGIGNNADTDDDGDGVPDTQDALPLDSTETLDTDGDGIGNYADTDDDGDGIIDGLDYFPLDSSETLDTDGDGIGNYADTDDDGDGIIDELDVFPLDSTETLDTDNDGVGDNADDLPLDSTETLDTDGDGIGNNMDTDDDGDDIIDELDAFPLDSSETVDTDNDGVGDNADAFPLDSSETLDTDNDGVGDNADEFPLDSSETLDTDGDGIGNNADTDDDGDGKPDATDPNPLDDDRLPDANWDGDNEINKYDIDDDEDGLIDELDAFPFDKNEQYDNDGDGIGNNADTDDDGDGVPDTVDFAPLDPGVQYNPTLQKLTSISYETLDELLTEYFTPDTDTTKLELVSSYTQSKPTIEKIVGLIEKDISQTLIDSDGITPDLIILDSSNGVVPEITTTRSATNKIIYSKSPSVNFIIQYNNNSYTLGLSSSETTDNTTDPPTIKKTISINNPNTFIIRVTQINNKTNLYQIRVRNGRRFITYGKFNFIPGSIIIKEYGIHVVNKTIKLNIQKDYININRN